MKINTYLHKILTLLAVILLLQGCTRDDICAEGIPTTPSLIIDFNDISNTAEAKNVTGLAILLLDVDNTVVQDISTTAQITIPLDTNDNFTRFQFISEANSDEPNLDVVIIRYEREDIYVNRACAFKTIYNNLSVEIINDDDNWVLSSEVNQTTVENEDATHLTIFH